MPHDLSRFHKRATEGWQDIALRELSAGRKQSHWIWWVFPQLDGLGQSRLAVHYALEDDEEAAAFLADPVLLDHLRAATAAVVRALDAGQHPTILMGNATDVRKLVSSLTLFAEICASEPPPQHDLRTLCEHALTKLADHGFQKCSYTLNALGR